MTEKTGRVLVVLLHVSGRGCGDAGGFPSYHGKARLDRISGPL